MKYEFEIEDLLVAHLQDDLPDIKIFPLGEISAQEMEMAAQKSLKGTIYVAYKNSDYERAGNSFVYTRKMKYIILALNKTRRQRDGIYDLLDLLRDSVYLFRAFGKRCTIVNDSIDPQRTPQGLFILEMEIRFDFTMPLEMRESDK